MITSTSLHMEFENGSVISVTAIDKGKTVEIRQGDHRVWLAAGEFEEFCRELLKWGETDG